MAEYFLPIYMYNNLGYELRKFSWLKMLIYLNILVAIVMPLNFQIIQTTCTSICSWC